MFDIAPPSAAALAVRERVAGVNRQPFHRRAFREEWPLAGGRILPAVGRPLSRGEYMMTLSDITDLRAAELLLQLDKEALERRVRDRTRELSDVNAVLAEATRVAGQATDAQKRFVAAASHDLVQPLHAARLFIANVLPALDAPPLRDMLARADQSGVTRPTVAAGAFPNKGRSSTRKMRIASSPATNASPTDTLATLRHDGMARGAPRATIP